MTSSISSKMITPEKMLWILACQAMVIAPHLLRIPVWLSIMSAGVGIWGYKAVSAKWKYPRRIILLLMVIIASTGIFINYGTLIGRNAGVALLITMLSLKILEFKTHKDVILFVYLGYFLVVTNFLFSQTMLIAIYMLAVSIGLTSTLIMLSRHGSELNLGKNVKQAVMMTLQAIPLMLVMFVLFPRLPSPLWFLPEDNSRAVTGLSDTMKPGAISELSRSDAVAFRVSFSDAIPPASQLYWRGPVLWQYDGKTWHTSYQKFLKRNMQGKYSGKKYTYTITLEPHQQYWLFALDTPSSIPPDSYINNGYSLISRNRIRNLYQYTSSSYTRYIIGDKLSLAEKKSALQLPENLNPKTGKWAREINRRFATAEEKAKYILGYFREKPFSYTLSPPLLGQNAVDDFLFNTRSGFCEHYASSFVYLMRLMNVPARIVLGYQGGEYNNLGKYMIVRQSDAHAWAEIWVRGKGWIRIDPTGAVSPDRVEKSIEAALPFRVSSGGLMRSDNPVLRTLILYWDSANYKWHNWVLGYDSAKQSSLLEKFGINSASWEDIAISIMVSLGSMLLLIALWVNMSNRRPRKDPTCRLYLKFCQKLGRIGFRQMAHEGPIDYATRVTGKRLDLKDEVDLITHIYIKLRYSRNPPTNLFSQYKKCIRKFHPRKNK
ncbi:MAG TPA: DUF3488 domain-containing protein [Gammaproteobacteria bacterium]|nr:DUF3488 domain-containing protein [Gammaproteobacteria bacterium]